MSKTPASSCVFLTFPGWASLRSGQASGDRGHTHSNTATKTNPLSLSQPETPTHPSITLKLLYTALPDCPIPDPPGPSRASITQSYVCQIEMGTSYVSGTMLGAGTGR